jgi:diaminohydroxyphosphoribosylaminopyrimidine deaminase/5-amino-6-(5-phosphoribosylamino)uracil reductase
MTDNDFMRQALELAKKGEGYVEPNPMVGCVLVREGQVLGQGYHTQFGQAHAEVEAIRSANVDLAGATCYVTLEPCSHVGKTPPCVQAILQTGIRRVVVAMRDPNPVVNGTGIRLLQEAGLSVTEHVLEKEARWLNAPYLTLLQKNRPWIHAKWAMTIDGRLAAKTYDSQWISGESSRKIVHQLRSRMDAIVIGAGTAKYDDPMLTVRLDEFERCGSKTPYRVVWDLSGSLSPESQLVRTAREVPVLMVTQSDDVNNLRPLEESGCEILRLPLPSHRNAQSYTDALYMFLEHCASRKWTHLLVEGGRRMFGTFFDAKCIDEVHVFVAPKLIGGESAVPVIGGEGREKMSLAALLEAPTSTLSDQDIYIRGRMKQ